MRARGQELKNVEKCLAVGYDQVLVVTEEAPQAKRLRAFILSSIPPKDAERVCVLPSDEIFSYLDTLVAGMTPPEETVRGYRVKVRQTPTSDLDARSRKEVIASVIAKSFRKLDD